MRDACKPFGPSLISNSTFWPSLRVRYPSASMAEKCAKTSSPPPSGEINPYPLALLNHFTVPVAMTAVTSLTSADFVGPLGLCRCRRPWDVGLFPVPNPLLWKHPRRMPVTTLIQQSKIVKYSGVSPARPAADMAVSRLRSGTSKSAPPRRLSGSSCPQRDRRRYGREHKDTPRMNRLKFAYD